MAASLPKCTSEELGVQAVLSCSRLLQSCPASDILIRQECTTVKLLLQQQEVLAVLLLWLSRHAVLVCR